MHFPDINWRSLKTKIILATLGIFLASIWSLSFYVSQMLRKDMERLLGEQQFSTVSLVAGQIGNELGIRLQALETVAGGMRPVMQEGQTAAVQAFVEQRLALLSLFNGGVMVHDLTGTAIADFPTNAGRLGVNYMDRDYVVGALVHQKPTISRPLVGRRAKAPVIIMAVPIRDGDGKVVGALSGVTNLAMPNFLSGIAQAHQGEGDGYLLVAPQQRVIILATEKERVLERLPEPGINPLIDRFVNGYEGSGVALNPHGLEVLTSAKGIPLVGWYLAANLPTAKAFAPIREMQRRMLFATLLLTLLAGGLTGWLLKRQLAPLLATARALAAMSDDGQPTQPLPIARDDEIGQLVGGFNRLLGTLGQREGLLKQILDTSSVAIFLVDLGGRITRANQCMAQMFGRPIDDLVGSEYVALVHPLEREIGRAKMSALLRSEVSFVELDRRYWRADGSEFWGHLTGQRFHDADGVDHGLVGAIVDIDVRKRAEQAVLSSKRQYDSLVSKIAVGIYILRSTPQGSFRLDYASPRMAEMLGMSVDSLVTDGDAISRAVHPDERDEFMRRNQAGIDEFRPFDWTGRVLVKGQGTGQVRWMHVSSAPELQENGDVLWHGLVEDVTERKLAEEKLHLAASVFTHAREGITITAGDGTIIDVNEAFTRITGYSREEAIGGNPRIIKSNHHPPEFYAAMWGELLEKGHWHGEIWNRRKSGEVYAEILTISAVRDEHGRAGHYVALFTDITPMKEHEKKLENMAHFDLLTTLPNRVLLADRMHQAMVQAQRHRQLLAVAYLDLDGFKAINDTYGHETGDQLLIALSGRMKTTLREVDTLARLGGDEFVAVLIDLADGAASEPMLNRLLAAAAQPVAIGDHVLQVSASLGVSFYPQNDDVDADQLLRQADQAMYQAKLAGKNRYHVFDSALDRSVRGQHEGLERIRQALNANELVLYYQPKVNMRTGAVIGVEALVRWQHPEKGLLAPVAFLPLIENHTLAVELGEWVIEAALVQLERWQDVGLDLPVSVNVGARQLQQAGFVDRLRAILAAHPRIGRGSLAMEVLETSALEDLIRVSEVIKDCREIGISFALDDFGTGYSSLTYLKRLPVSLLKIDQSFVRDMLDDPDDLAILEGVISLAKAFQREVIAEGVETVEHGEMLLQLGCELAQGYGIARPMPAHEIPGWAQSWRPEPIWQRASAIGRDDLPLVFASVEHRAWIAAMVRHLRDDRSAPPLDLHLCRFGTWLNNEGRSRFGRHPDFHEIDRIHKKVHDLALELCDLRALGRAPEALIRVDELHGHRDTLLRKLKELIREDYA
jgi:diguanylate cyclase (GGDEF)-like protein/PAS domain S-box-containing protein